DADFFARQPTCVLSERPRWQAGPLPCPCRAVRGRNGFRNLMLNRRRACAAACSILALLLAAPASAQIEKVLGDRARQYLIDLIRLDSTNPPGNETRVANYLKKVADAEGIASELLGGDPARLSFIARLAGTGERPLLLMAHSDVVPA